MSIIILAAVLGFLLMVIGGTRGLRTIATLVINFVLFIILARLILNGVNPVFAAVTACILICLVTLCINVGLNAKSIAAFASVIFVVLMLWLIVECIGRGSRIEGFPFQRLSDIAGYSLIINIDMGDLVVACILMGLIGAVTDTAIAVVSAQFEVAYNNPDLSFGDIWTSGCRVGRDLIGTTCNTLFFAYLGGYLALLIWFRLYRYSFAEIINSAVFAEEFLRVAASALGCVLVMPVSALFGALILRTRLSCILDVLERTKSAINRWLDSNPYRDENNNENNGGTQK